MLFSDQTHAAVLAFTAATLCAALIAVVLAGFWEFARCKSKPNTQARRVLEAASDYLDNAPAVLLGVGVIVGAANGALFLVGRGLSLLAS